MEGTYQAVPDAIVYPLILPQVEYDKRAQPWVAITLSGNPEHELVAVLKSTS